MRPGPSVRVVPPAALVPEACAWLERALAAALAARGRAHLALSGGSTPRPIYRALAGRPLAWGQVDFYFVDERCVPPDSPESNWRLAHEALLGPLGVEGARVHRMEGERADREAAAAGYAARLPGALDVVLLGMGEDGHTASLFPGAAALEERARRCVAVQGPKPPPWRLTLTLPVLSGARAVLGVVAGAGKREAVRALRAGGPIPAARVEGAEWLVDAEAAGEPGAGGTR